MKKIKLITILGLATISTSPVLIACKNKTDGGVVTEENSNWTPPSSLTTDMNSHNTLIYYLQEFTTEVTNATDTNESKNKRSVDKLIAIFQKYLSDSFTIFGTSSYVTRFSRSNLERVEESNDVAFKTRFLTFDTLDSFGKSNSYTIEWKVYVSASALLNNWKVGDLANITLDDHNNLIEKIKDLINNEDNLGDEFNNRLYNALVEYGFVDTSAFPPEAVVTVDKEKLPSLIQPNELNSYNTLNSVTLNIRIGSEVRQTNITWKVFKTLDEVIDAWKVPTQATVLRIANENFINSTKLLGEDYHLATGFYKNFNDNISNSITKFAANTYVKIVNFSDLIDSINANDFNLKINLQISRGNLKSKVREVELKWLITSDETQILNRLSDQTTRITYREYQNFYAQYNEIKRRLVPNSLTPGTSEATSLSLEKARDLASLINQYFDQTINLPSTTLLFELTSNLSLIPSEKGELFEVIFEVNNKRSNRITYKIDIGDVGDILQWNEPQVVDITTNKHNAIVEELRSLSDPKISEIRIVLLNLFPNLIEIPTSFKIDANDIPEKINDASMSFGDIKEVSYQISVSSSIDSKVLSFKWRAIKQDSEVLEYWNTPGILRIKQAKHIEFINEINDLTAHMSTSIDNLHTAVSQNVLDKQQQTLAELNQVIRKIFLNVEQFDVDAVLLTKLNPISSPDNISTSKIQLYLLDFEIAHKMNNGNATGKTSTYTLKWEVSSIANLDYQPPNEATVDSRTNDLVANSINKLSGIGEGDLTKIYDILNRNIYLQLPSFPADYNLVSKTAIDLHSTQANVKKVFSIIIENEDGHRINIEFKWQINQYDAAIYSFLSGLNNSYALYENYDSLRKTIKDNLSPDVLGTTAAKSARVLESFRKEFGTSLSLPPLVLFFGFEKVQNFDVTNITESTIVKFKLKFLNSNSNTEITPSVGLQDFEVSINVMPDAVYVESVANHINNLTNGLVSLTNHNKMVTEFAAIKSNYGENNAISTQKIMELLTTYLSVNFSKIGSNITIKSLTLTNLTSQLTFNVLENYVKPRIVFTLNSTSASSSSITINYEIFNDQSSGIYVPKTTSINLTTHNEVISELKNIVSSSDSKRQKLERVASLLSEKVYKTQVTIPQDAELNSLFNLDEKPIYATSIYRLTMYASLSLAPNSPVVNNYYYFMWDVVVSESEAFAAWSINNQVTVKISLDHYKKLITALKTQPNNGQPLTAAQAATMLTTLTNFLTEEFALKNFASAKLVLSSLINNLSTITPASLTGGTYNLNFNYHTQNKSIASNFEIILEVGTTSELISSYKNYIENLWRIDNPFKYYSLDLANKALKTLRDNAANSNNLYTALKNLGFLNLPSDFPTGFSVSFVNNPVVTDFVALDANKNFSTDLKRALKIEFKETAAPQTITTITFYIEAEISDVEVLNLISTATATTKTLTVQQHQLFMDMIAGSAKPSISEFSRFVRQYMYSNQTLTDNASLPHDKDQPRNTVFGPFYSSKNGSQNLIATMTESQIQALRVGNFQQAAKEITVNFMVGLGVAKKQFSGFKYKVLADVDEAGNLTFPNTVPSTAYMWGKSQNRFRSLSKLTKFKQEADNWNVVVASTGFTTKEYAEMTYRMGALMSNLLDYTIKGTHAYKSWFRITKVTTTISNNTSATVEVKYNVLQEGVVAANTTNITFNDLIQDSVSELAQRNWPRAAVPINIEDWLSLRRLSESDDIKSALKNYLGNLLPEIRSDEQIQKVSFSNNSHDATTGNSKQRMALYLSSAPNFPIIVNLNTTAKTYNEDPFHYNTFAPGTENFAFASGTYFVLTNSFMNLKMESYALHLKQANVWASNNYDTTMSQFKLLGKYVFFNESFAMLRDNNIIIDNYVITDTYATNKKYKITFDLVIRNPDNSEKARKSFVWNWSDVGVAGNQAPNLNLLNLNASRGRPTYRVSKEQYNLIAQIYNETLDYTRKSGSKYTIYPKFNLIYSMMLAATDLHYLGWLEDDSDQIAVFPTTAKKIELFTDNSAPVIPASGTVFEIHSAKVTTPTTTFSYGFNLLII